MRGRARNAWMVSVIAVVVAGVTIATAGQKTVVIYPGDYVVQAGDLTPDGQWREGVSPSAVVARPGDTVVQATDFDVLARWRIDVDAATGAIEVEAVDPTGAKAIVNPYLTVPVILCIDCNGNASTTRNIRLSGFYDSLGNDFTWDNPLLGWPSVPVSYNVTSAGPAVFTGSAGPPYSDGEDFTVDFPVVMTTWGPFSIWVDILGDLN